MPAISIRNGQFDCGRAYLYGHRIPVFMTGMAGMGYELLKFIMRNNYHVFYQEKFKSQGVIIVLVITLFDIFVRGYKNGKKDTTN